MDKKNDINKTKQRLLDCAEMLFSERGYDAVSADDIAKSAGSTKSTLFYYFEKKQDILYTLMKLKRDCAVERFKEYVKEKGYSASKEDIYRRCVGFVEENKDIFRIAIFEFLKTGTGTNIIMELPNEAFKAFESIFTFTKEDRLRLIVTIIRTTIWLALCDNLCESFDISEDELRKMYPEELP